MLQRNVACSKAQQKRYLLIDGNIPVRFGNRSLPLWGFIARNTAVKLPLNRRETADKVPANEQEKQIYKYVSENAGITTAQAMKLLGIKQRRTREILVKMVEKGWLRKEGYRQSNARLALQKLDELEASILHLGDHPDIGMITR